MLKRIEGVLPATSTVALTLWLVFSSLAFAETPRDEEKLLEESEYRSELEEVVVVGKQPEWRTNTDKEEWRPQRFELPESSNTGRIEWFPEYTKDERDNYDGVRDRMGEKAEFKIFEWKF